MSRTGLHSRAITRTYGSISVAALSVALFWPVTSFASPDYTDRALRKNSIELSQPNPALSTGRTSAPIYNSYYGPVIRPASIFGGRW